MQIFSIPIIELALGSALLSLFLDLCFREGNIFEKWPEFLADWWLKENYPIVLKFVEGKTDKQIIQETEGEYEGVRDYKFKHVKWFWFKPLGGCVICMNVWISFATCALFWLQLESLLSALLVVLLSSFIVRFFQEKIV